MAIVADAGRLAAERSFKLAMLRTLGGITGIAGGVLSYIVSTKKSDAELQSHNYTASTLYTLSAYSFGATSVTSVALTIGTVAATLEARAIGGAVVEAAAARLAAGAVIATVSGVALTISGVGLILLGAGIVFQVGAIVLTPTMVQRWIGRSYFGRDGGLIFNGKRDDMFVKGDWIAEKKELEALFRQSEETKKEAKVTCS